MNVFYVDSNPVIAATMLCDAHTVKMILETAQLLSTAMHETGQIGPLKPTHKNHPSAIWARQSKKNYSWLLRHFARLCGEYNSRYGKIHKYDNFSMYKTLVGGITAIPVGEFTPPPQCMPDQYKFEDDTVSAYRAYYLGEKSKFAKWKHGNEPAWYTQGMLFKAQLTQLAPF